MTIALFIVLGSIVFHIKIKGQVIFGRTESAMCVMKI
jgi:hypothetical protein